MQSVSAASSSGGVEETSPDMLKNTPSNIRRLAHEIEQHDGRQKYLAQTRSPSDGGDVRWYFCKVPLGINGKVLIKKENVLIFIAIYALELFFNLVPIY